MKGPIKIIGPIHKEVNKIVYITEINHHYSVITNKALYMAKIAIVILLSTQCNSLATISRIKEMQGIQIWCHLIFPQDLIL